MIKHEVSWCAFELGLRRVLSTFYVNTFELYSLDVGVDNLLNTLVLGIFASQV